jgi:hypothetical protein
MTAGDELVFHQLKKIEIIVRGERTGFVRDLLERSGATGYTLLRDVAGLGHHGFHEGRLLYNDQASVVMFIAVGVGGGDPPRRRRPQAAVREAVGRDVHLRHPGGAAGAFPGQGGVTPKAATRGASLPEGYATAPSSGLRPSCGVLPPAGRARHGTPLQPAILTGPPAPATAA